MSDPKSGEIVSVAAESFGSVSPSTTHVAAVVGAAEAVVVDARTVVGGGEVVVGAAVSGGVDSTTASVVTTESVAGLDESELEQAARPKTNTAANANR